MSEKPSILQGNPPTSYLDATGEIKFKLTNDYMFRAIPQKNPKVLKGLISSMLHISPEEITNVRITNPILLGESIKDKGFVLDIHVNLNNNTVINIEMQVLNEHNWPTRSLSYLCRVFDQLVRNQEYNEAMSVIHIGFLDFQPFADNPEFYSTYKLLNIKNQHLYSDKFTMSVVDLTHIELATEEDKAYQIDHWARLFKATTWEEIKMIAANNEYMTDAVQALYECNSDENIREQCYAREEQIREKNYYIQSMKEMEAALKEMGASLMEKNTSIKEKDAEIARLRALLAERDK